MMTLGEHCGSHRISSLMNIECLKGVVRDCFFEPSMGLLEIPYSIVPYTEDVVRRLRVAAGCELGIWGECPPYKNDRSINLSGDPIDPDCFKLWGCEYNHTAVSEYVRQRRSTSQFSMIISTDTNVEVLKKMAIEAVDLSDYDFYITRLGVWLTELQWALIPMWDENEYANVLFSKMHSSIKYRFDSLS